MKIWDDKKRSNKNRALVHIAWKFGLLHTLFMSAVYFFSPLSHSKFGSNELGWHFHRDVYRIYYKARWTNSIESGSRINVGQMCIEYKDKTVWIPDGYILYNSFLAKKFHIFIIRIKYKVTCFSQSMIII